MCLSVPLREWEMPPTSKWLPAYKVFLKGVDETPVWNVKIPTGKTVKDEKEGFTLAYLDYPGRYSSGFHVYASFEAAKQELSSWGEEDCRIEKILVKDIVAAGLERDELHPWRKIEVWVAHTIRRCAKNERIAKIGDNWRIIRSPKGS